MSDTYPLRPVPHRLIRSTATFALAGTVMAAAVWTDPAAHRALPIGMALVSWAIPLFFYVQIRRLGFDPLLSLTLAEDGLVAEYRDGNARRLPWGGVTRLVRAEGRRLHGRAVAHASLPAIRWFGELADEPGFMAAIAAKTGLEWESASTLPEDPA